MLSTREAVTSEVRGTDGEGTRKNLLDDENVPHLDQLVVTQGVTMVVYLKFVHLTSCKLYFNLK